MPRTSVGLTRRAPKPDVTIHQWILVAIEPHLPISPPLPLSQLLVTVRRPSDKICFGLPTNSVLIKVERVVGSFLHQPSPSYETVGITLRRTVV